MELINKNPALFSVLCFVSAYAWEAWGKKLTLTSVWREENDPNHMHRNWRAVDCRVYNVGRDGDSPEITPSEWQELVGMINRTFRYGKTWFGRPTVVAHYRTGTDSDTAPHVHLQTKGRFWR